MNPHPERTLPSGSPKYAFVLMDKMGDIQQDLGKVEGVTDGNTKSIEDLSLRVDDNTGNITTITKDFYTMKGKSNGINEERSRWQSMKDHKPEIAVGGISLTTAVGLVLWILGIVPGGT